MNIHTCVCTAWGTTCSKYNGCHHSCCENFSSDRRGMRKPSSFVEFQRSKAHRRAVAKAQFECPPQNARDQKLRSQENILRKEMLRSPKSPMSIVATRRVGQAGHRL